MDVNNTLSGFHTMAATFANDVNQAFWVNFWISLILGLSVIIPMFYFAWKYRESNVKDEEIENVTHNTKLEIAWTLIPTLLMMVLFYYGYSSMKSLRTMPADSESIVIKVEGSKWKWKYEYPANKSGHIHKITSLYDQSTGGVKRGLYVPVGTNIILKMTAPLNDVIHSYYIPAFRMKEDVVPGRTTKQWFKADVVGTYDVECAEYCGTAHAYMYSKIVVMEKEEYEKWFESDAMSPGEAGGAAMSKGQQLYEENGCAACHASDSDVTLVGPSLQAIGKKHDAAYLKNAILNPNKDVPAGFFPGVMPPYALSDEDATELVKYLQEL